MIVCYCLADDFDIDKRVWRDPLSEALGVTETDVVEPLLPVEEFQNEVLNESISVRNDFCVYCKIGCGHSIKNLDIHSCPASCQYLRSFCRCDVNFE